MIYDTFKYYLLPHSADLTKRASLVTIGAFFLDAAGMAANKHGFGMNTLHAEQKAWVVARMSMEVLAAPTEYQWVTVDTWVKSVNPIASERCFVLRDESGAAVAMGSTCWSVIDLSTRKLLDLTQTTILSRFVCTEPPADYAMAAAIKVPQIKGDFTATQHRVVYGDLDMNKHVNSMRYLQWSMDALPLTTIERSGHVRVHINYMHEVFYGEEAQIRMQADGNNYLFEVARDAASCCKIKIEFLESE